MEVIRANAHQTLIPRKSSRGPYRGKGRGRRATCRLGQGSGCRLTAELLVLLRRTAALPGTRASGLFGGYMAEIAAE